MTCDRNIQLQDAPPSPGIQGIKKAEKDRKSQAQRQLEKTKESECNIFAFFQDVLNAQGFVERITDLIRGINISLELMTILDGGHGPRLSSTAVEDIRLLYPG